MDGTGLSVSPVSVREPDVLAMVEALTAELAGEGYTAEQSFGYTPEQLERGGVHLVGARAGGALVGIAGIELQADATAELRRFFVAPDQRGRGAADALMAAVLGYAREHGVRLLRLETGDKQTAARRYYARHGFVPVPRFGPYVDSATSVCMQRELPAG